MTLKNKNIYPRSIIDGVNAIIQSCLNDSDSTFRATAPNYLTNLYESPDKEIFPIDAYRCIWYNLIKFERHGEFDWIKAYWEYAVSYAQISLQSYVSDESDNSFLFKFQEFHHMYCAYLLSCGRYELVEHLLSYSNTIPYSNPLVIRYWREALTHLSEFEKPLYFDGNYSFYLNNGVKDEGIGQCWLIILYLTCLIKDDDASDFYQYDEIMKLRSYKSLLANINSIIENSRYWKSLINDSEYRSIFDLNAADLDKVKEKVRSLYEGINENIDEKERNQPIDIDVVNEYKERIKELVRSYLSEPNTPIQINDINIKALYIQVPIFGNKISKDFFSKQPSMAYLNFVESYAYMTYTYISDIYRSQFIHNSSIRTYLIDYNELSEALDRLDANDGFCALCMGVDRNIIPNSHFMESDIYYIPSRDSSVILMKKTDLPIMKLKPDLIDIDVIPISGDKNCSIEGKINFSYPETIVRYIKLKLEHLSYMGRPSSISKIEPIKNFIV